LLFRPGSAGRRFFRIHVVTYPEWGEERKAASVQPTSRRREAVILLFCAVGKAVEGFMLITRAIELMPVTRRAASPSARDRGPTVPFTAP
jgi:hypothetical protein